MIVQQASTVALRAFCAVAEYYLTLHTHNLAACCDCSLFLPTTIFFEESGKQAITL